MKKLRFLWPLLALALVLTLAFTFTACTSDDDPGDTNTSTESNAPSDTDDGTDSVTDTDTDSDTDTETDSETISETESATESETDDDSPYPVKQLTIAGVDISEFSIVKSSKLPSGYPALISYFVEELAKATGVTVPVVEDTASVQHAIFLGATPNDTDRVIAARSEIKYDGFAWVVENGNLYITDSTGKGTGIAFGMTTFLEEYAGVTVYTSYYTAYHKMGKVDVPADLYEVSNPSFEGRDVDYYDIELQEDTNKHLRAFYRNNRDGSYLIGIGNSSFIVANNGYRGHTIGALSETGDALSDMPCLTDENIYQTVLKNVRMHLDNRTNARSISVSVGDGIDHNCQCANCQAIEDQYGGPSGLIIWFCNKIADGIRDDYPNVLIETIAYDYAGQAPTGIKARDNVAVRICTDQCCFSHAYTDPDCPKNTKFRENFEKWAEVCDNLLIWDYPNNFANPNYPDPSIFVQLENIRYFKQHNVIEYFGEGTDVYPSGDFDNLMGFLLFKILWNADMTDEEYAALIDQALVDMYGDAAPYIKEYLVAVDKAASETGCTAIYTALENFYKMVDEKGLPTTDTDKADTSFLLEMYGLWQKAMNVKTLTEGQQRNVEQTSAHIYMAVSRLVKDESIRKPAMLMYRRLCKRYNLYLLA